MKTSAKGTSWHNSDLSENQMQCVFLGILIFVVIVGCIASGNKTARAAAIWVGGLALVVVVVAAIVGTTSASWAAGRRVVAGAPPSPSAPAVPDGKQHGEGSASSRNGAVAAELAELARLHREGALTPDEFASAKARVLEG